MLFNSPEFLVFFLVVFGAYWAVPCQKARVILLLAASYYFYMSWNATLAAVVACSSLADFFIGWAMDDTASDRRRKTLLVLSIVMNLGLLCYFKYSNFFLASLHALLGRLGIHREMPVLAVVLPIGISFYTFEAVSYMTDVYTRRTAAEKNPVHFLLFITFFPRMIAGPIIRARNFLPQLKRKRRFDWGRFDLGLQYVLMGLLKKMGIADRMAALADPVYASPGDYSTSAVWVAVLAYSLQIYCDFSGYSDIAIGTAHMLGFKLPRNFNMPYMSRNIAEFWRRWHISLSTWLRDYVFISMGGSRGTAVKTAFTLMMTMALCGLWHGAYWAMVGWGMLQGFLMIGHRQFRQFCKTRPGLNAALETRWGVASRVFFTFMVVTFGWVLFRAQGFAKAGVIYHALFVPQRGMMVRSPVGPWALVMALAMVAIPHLVVESGLWKRMTPRLSPPAWGIAYVLVVISICMLVVQSNKAFIYFQF